MGLGSVFAKGDYVGGLNIAFANNEAIYVLIMHAH